MAKTAHPVFAHLYDLFMVLQDRFGLHRQRAKLCREATGRVLEVAIGTGLNIPHYTGAACVVGIDPDLDMMRLAIRRTWESPVPVRLIAADARHLPFPDATFDTVVVGLSLCTIPDPAIALEELARVTVPGGRLHFLEHVRSRRPRTARLQDRWSQPWERISGGCRANQDTGMLLEESSWCVSTVWTSDSGGLIRGSATAAPPPQCVGGTDGSAPVPAR